MLVAGGGRFVMLTAVSQSASAFSANGAAVARLVNGIKLTTTIQVESGNPPLTRYLLDETTDFLDWLMQVSFTDAQRATIDAEIRGSWKKNDRKEIDGVIEVLTARQQLAVMKPAERDIARQAVLDDAVKQWRTEQKESPSARIMVEIYDNARKPIVAGNPPLTRQNVDAFAEFLCFAAGQTAGINFTLSVEIRDQLAAAVANSYAGIARAQRALIAQMTLTWASLRAAWPEISDAEKKQLVDAWKKDPQVVQLGRQFQAATKTSQAASTSQTASAPQTASKLTLAEVQAKMQQQQATFITMSNIMRIQHDASRVMISNIGGRGWTYEYQWR